MLAHVVLKRFAIIALRQGHGFYELYHLLAIELLSPFQEMRRRIFYSVEVKRVNIKVGGYVYFHAPKDIINKTLNDNILKSDLKVNG